MVENGDKNREKRKVEIDIRGDFFNWWGGIVEPYGDDGWCYFFNAWMLKLEISRGCGIEREGGLSRLTDYSDLHWKQF